MSVINLTVPVSYNSLSRKQLLQVCRLFLAGLGRNSFLVRAFCHLAGLRPLGTGADGNPLFLFGKQVLPIGLDEFNGFVASQLYLLDMGLTRNRMPAIRVGLRRFHGPANRCYNLTLREYLHAENALFAYGVTREFRYIDHLCAILYRPSGKGSSLGDPRQPFNEFVSLQRRSWFRIVSREKRFLVFLFYSGCRMEFTREFPNLFSGSVTSSRPESPARDILHMVRILNNNDITKNETILGSSLWEAFAQLNDLAGRNAKSKKHG